MSNSEDPRTHGTDPTETEMPGRSMPLFLLFLGGSGLLINHWFAISLNVISPWLAVMAPPFLLLGLGGLIDPRIVLSIGPKGQHFPLKIKIIGGILAVTGMILAAYLALGVYRLQDAALNASERRGRSSYTP